MEPVEGSQRDYTLFKSIFALLSKDSFESEPLCDPIMTPFDSDFESADSSIPTYITFKNHDCMI